MGDNFKKVENMLFSVERLKAYIKIIEKNLKDLEELDGVVAINYQEVPTHTNHIQRVTEDIAIKKIEKKNRFIDELIKTKEKLNGIETAISLLDDDQYKVIKFKYLDKNKLYWYQISAEMNYSVSWCKILRKRAIENLANMLFGEISLNSITMSS